MAASLNSLLKLFLSDPGTASFIALPKHIRQMSANDAMVASPQINKAVNPGTESNNAIAGGTRPLKTEKARYKKMILNLVIEYSSQVSNREAQPHLLL